MIIGPVVGKPAPSHIIDCPLVCPRPIALRAVPPDHVNVTILASVRLLNWCGSLATLLITDETELRLRVVEQLFKHLMRIVLTKQQIGKE